MANAVEIERTTVFIGGRDGEPVHAPVDRYRVDQYGDGAVGDRRHFGIVPHDAFGMAVRIERNRSGLVWAVLDD